MEQPVTERIMANTVQGFLNKNARIAAAKEKLANNPGDYECTIIFSKGERRGVLAIWEHLMEWNVFADPLFTTHVDWNDSDCTFLDILGNGANLLSVISLITQNGFIEKSRYEH